LGFGIDEGNVIDFILLLITFYAKLETRDAQLVTRTPYPVTRFISCLPLR